MKLEVKKLKVGIVPVLEVVSKERINERLPLIIYYHGWQTSKELVLTQGRKIAQKGFRVILPDAANHGERKTPVSDIPSFTFFQSIHANLFEFESLIAYFKRAKLTNEFIGVGGVSMGGMTTCALMTHHPEINAAACVMGSPSLIAYRDMLKTHISERGIFLPRDYDDLTSWMRLYDLSSYYQHLPKIPLYFWHGKEDEKIPFSQTNDFVKKHLNPFIIFHAANESHMVKGPTMDKVADFFASSYQI